MTICTHDRQHILSDIRRGGALLRPTGEIVKKNIYDMEKRYGVKVHPYVIMPDHIHMIIHINSGTMWASSPTKEIKNIIRSLKILTTKEIGESIFQRSYYDHVIRNQKDYNEIWEYIENNPKKWILTHR